MFELIILAITLLGSSVGAAIDLKTTEIPDKVFYAMLALGLPLMLLQAYLNANMQSLILSCIVGLAFLGFGIFMYKIGQWAELTQSCLL